MFGSFGRKKKCYNQGARLVSKLIWVIAGSTCPWVGFVVHWFIVFKRISCIILILRKGPRQRGVMHRIVWASPVYEVINTHMKEVIYVHKMQCKLYTLKNLYIQMRRDMSFPTMWYLRQAKPQISLRICAVWPEPLLVAWIFYDC